MTLLVDAFASRISRHVVCSELVEHQSLFRLAINIHQLKIS